MRLELDHTVVAVSNPERSNAFYERVLGAQVAARGAGVCYRFLNAQLNVHAPGTSATPLARVPVVPGGSDLCFVWRGSVAEAQAHLQSCGVTVELGPVERSGKGGAGTSLYFRDPDGSLLELIVYPANESTLRPVTLENEWVRLEPLSSAHLDALWRVAQDERITQHFWIRFGAKSDLACYIETYEHPAQPGGTLGFAVWDTARGEFVGATTFLDFSPERLAVEIGSTWLAPGVWGTRTNPAMKFLMLEHAFESLGLARVFFKTDNRNERSQRAIEKIGATREGVLRKHMKRPDGTWRDSVYFSILDDEWPRVKDGLDARLRA